MARKKKASIGQIFLTSIIAGLLISFGFQPLYEICVKLAGTYINLGPWNEIIVMAVLGMLYLGVMIYLIVVTFLNSFARNVFKVLLYEMRCKELLPPGFKVTKRRRFNHVYEDIMSVFDNFVHNYMQLKKEKDKYSKTMDKYLDPSLKQEIDSKGGAHEFYVGGKKKTATILFCDLRGFTTFTEAHDPHDVVKILNDYFSFATSIITKNRGRVNKYIGDAILAVFEEAPKYIDYIDADKAIIAGLDIQTQFKLKMREWKAIDPTLTLGLGVGLARGEIVTGNMGSEERMEYTVIGDTVNFASRLCGKAKDGQVMISKEVYSMVEQLVEVEVLAPVEVKGKAGTHEVYAVKTRKMIS